MLAMSIAFKEIYRWKKWFSLINVLIKSCTKYYENIQGLRLILPKKLGGVSQMRGQLLDQFSLLCFLWFYCLLNPPTKIVSSTHIFRHLNHPETLDWYLIHHSPSTSDPTIQQIMSSLSLKYITNPSTSLHIYYHCSISSPIIYLLNCSNSLQMDFPNSTLDLYQFPIHKEAIMTQKNLPWQRYSKVQWI